MSLPTAQTAGGPPRAGPLVDRFGRVHTYVRVSVTDRCNYRCTYCMPAEGLTWLRRGELLSFEETHRIVGVFAGMGVRRIRLTGGEPTIRRDLRRLVELIASVPGIEDVSMTTNAHRFAAHAHALAEAGLRRVNISLDSLDAQRFAEMTRGGDLARVLDGIAKARDAGLVPIKINCVVINGTNDGEVHDFVDTFARWADDTVVRFIEFMPFDGNDLAERHLPAAVIRERLAERWSLRPGARRGCGGGPAESWILDNGLEVGFVSPITGHFCQTCNRLRLSADGHLRTCLSRDDTPSLRDVLRAGASDAELEALIRSAVWAKVPGHEAHAEGGGRMFEGVMTRVGG